MALRSATGRRSPADLDHRLKARDARPGSLDDSRYVRVPDFRGILVGKTFTLALRAGVKTKIVRLIDNPAPVEGVVVGQVPPPGRRVRRDTVVTLSVFHPPKATEPRQAT